MEAPYSFAAVIVAAGQSTRFSDKTSKLKQKKEYQHLNSVPIINYSIQVFLSMPECISIVVVVPQGGKAEAESVIGKPILQSCGQKLIFTTGGQERPFSVKAGLDALNTIKPDYVLVHDAARPYITTDLAYRVLDGAIKHGAAIPAIDVVDTIKVVQNSFVHQHLTRASLKAVQTPQAYKYSLLLKAYETMAADNFRSFSDDSMLLPESSVFVVDGDRSNIKITYKEDMDSKTGFLNTKVGQGWDIHRLVMGRKLVLGGFVIPHDFGEDGHSDGDVLYHALTDAILGSIAAGDIGKHFPPSNPQWKNAASDIFVKHAINLLKEKGWELVNIDITVILEKPKLLPYIDDIRKSVALCTGLDINAISIKAKTNEGLDSIGKGEAIEAQAIVLIKETV